MGCKLDNWLGNLYCCYMLNNTDNTVSRFSLLRSRDGEWCKVTIELRTRNGVQELSITGAAGVVMTERQARAEALEYWVSFFEECPEEIYSMNKRFGRQFRTARGAAKFVIDCDGEYHGLDVVEEEDGNVFVSHSCGQIRAELAEWFPEIGGLYRWHLNGMQAGCFHQALQGRTYKTDPGHECPACGTKLGHSWNAWPLPPRVLAKVEALRALAN